MWTLKDLHKILKKTIGYRVRKFTIFDKHRMLVMNQIMAISMTSWLKDRKAVVSARESHKLGVIPEIEYP